MIPTRLPQMLILACLANRRVIEGKTAAEASRPPKHDQDLTEGWRAVGFDRRCPNERIVNKPDKLS